MRNTPNYKAERHRMPGYGGSELGNNGPFVVGDLLIVASDGGGWDHVSVSLKNRLPTWEEMQQIKELFFRDDECVMQLHPPKTDWINNHANCLHLWRPQGAEIPMPPGWMVGLKGVSPEELEDKLQDGTAYEALVAEAEKSLLSHGG